MQKHDDRNSPTPSSTQFCPNIRPIKRPRSQQDNQLLGAVQKTQDVFLKLRADVNVGFVKEGSRATPKNFAGDLLCYPRVRTAVADKHQTFVEIGRAHV